MSFRIKLLLMMMLVVAGVTTVTLYLTERKVRATYQKLFQEQFEAEVKYFADQRETGTTALREGCENLAKSPRFIEAIKSGNARDIYDLALQQTNMPAARRLRGGTRPNGTPIQPLGFLRVLDAQGNIIRAPDSRGVTLVGGRRRLDQQLAGIQKAMGRLESSQVGFLLQEFGTNRESLSEVIVARVADPDTQQTIGALVLGLPFTDPSERTMQEMSRIQSGIWFENRIHNGTMSEDMRAAFSKLMAGIIGTNCQPHETYNIDFAGGPQRVFFKLVNPDSPFPPAYRVSLYSLAGAVKTENEIRWQIIGFSTLTLLAALVLCLGVAHQLSTPLRELVAGTAAVRAGDFGVKVPVRSRDEVGELAASFNEMAEGLAQKERYRTVLNMVADEKVAHELVNGRLALGGELRDITVLFCDVRGFTALTQNMPPEEVIEMLNEHMTALTRVVKEQSGVLDKFVGDLIMAIFGAPVVTETDTLNAARCALRLISERERLNDTSRHKLQIGIGIATGRVVAGCMGSFDRLNYTVIGERVNLGSRLCGHAGPGQIIIDKATRDSLGDLITAKPLPALNLKGFSEDVTAYELEAVHSWELSAEPEQGS